MNYGVHMIVDDDANERDNIHVGDNANEPQLKESM